MTVNFLGVVELSRHIVPAMVTRGSGELVVVSSVQGVLPIPFRSDMCWSLVIQYKFISSLV